MFLTVYVYEHFLSAREMHAHEIPNAFGWHVKRMRTKGQMRSTGVSNACAQKDKHVWLVCETRANEDVNSFTSNVKHVCAKA